MGRGPGIPRWVEAVEDKRKLMISALMPTYNRADLAFERGEGVWLWTTDGRRFLDCGAGIATSSLGHNNKHLVQAIAEQAARVMHVSNLYRVPQAERLAQAASGSDVRGQRVLLQLGRRGERGHDQDDPQGDDRGRQGRTIPDHLLRRRVPRPHARDPRRYRQSEIPCRLRPCWSTDSTTFRSTT